MSALIYFDLKSLLLDGTMEKPGCFLDPFAYKKLDQATESSHLELKPESRENKLVIVG